MMKNENLSLYITRITEKFRDEEAIDYEDIGDRWPQGRGVI